MKLPFSHRQVLWLATAMIVLMIIGIIQIGEGLRHQYESYALIRDRLDQIDREGEIRQAQILQIKQLEARLSRFPSDTFSIGNHLDFVHYLENLAAQHMVRIIALPQEQISHEGQLAVSVESFHLEGTFHHLLRVLYQLERIDQVGTITYAHLEREELSVRGKRKPFLVARIELKRLTQTELP